MKALSIRIVGVMVALMIVISGGVTVHAQEPGEQDFRQDPTIDFRSVILDITTDSDAQFEIVIANPTLNDKTALAGDITFRVPPGMTIYSSVLGGTGGTGIVLVPFTQDPIIPGDSKVFTFYARSTEVGDLAVSSFITYWPNENMDLAKTVNRQFPISVKEPSKLQGLPGALEDELGSSDQAPGNGAAGSFSLSGDDNPLGWPNWFLILVFGLGTLIVLFIVILTYRLIKAKIEY